MLYTYTHIKYNWMCSTHYQLVFNTLLVCNPYVLWPSTCFVSYPLPALCPTLLCAISSASHPLPALRPTLYLLFVHPLPTSCPTLVPDTGDVKIKWTITQPAWYNGRTITGFLPSDTPNRYTKPDIPLYICDRLWENQAFLANQKKWVFYVNKKLQFIST